MRTLLRSRLVLPVAFLILQACGGNDSTGPSSDLDGTWQGGTSSNGITFNLTMTITETSHDISGSGTISGSGPTCSVAITGTHHGTTVDLSISCPGFIPIGFTGDASHSEAITGHVSGSGLPATTFDLIRQ